MVIHGRWGIIAMKWDRIEIEFQGCTVFRQDVVKRTSVTTPLATMAVGSVRTGGGKIISRFALSKTFERVVRDDRAGMSYNFSPLVYKEVRRPRGIVPLYAER
jgi:hypothetical protein